jgi:hypothetical protein
MFPVAQKRGKNGQPILFVFNEDIIIKHFKPKISVVEAVGAL